MVLPRESLGLDADDLEPLLEDALRLGAPRSDDTQHTVAELRSQIATARSGATAGPVVVPDLPWVSAFLEANDVTAVRQLLQLRCPLPVTDDVHLAVHPFRPGTVDETDWLAVNNRSFSWHPEQSDRTIDDLHTTMSEPWFDADGFLLHHAGHVLAGFCWTKIHPPADGDPALGEIFVIGVDPAFHGRGLGRGLALAGLSWVHDHGAELGMLYVEHDNAPALGLYRSLGFAEHLRTAWLAPRRPPPGTP